VGYQWKPFDSIADDDRDMDYLMFQIGAGYQLTDRLYASLAYERYDVELQDGNTAFQAYQLHEMASGQHDKNKLIVGASYILGGAEFGLNYEYDTGEFAPDFGEESPWRRHASVISFHWPFR
jgi:predicted porin